MNSVHAKVNLLGYTTTINGGGPEDVVAAAGKLCYSKVGANEILEKMTKDDIEKFLNNLSNFGHYSPFEHASFTFIIEGISRTCSHQIVRHRIASYSQQSQRYVDLKDTIKIIVPKEIENDENIKQKYIDSIMNDYDAYVDITNSLVDKYKKIGIEEKVATKKALEDARFALPNACETKMVMTMNARSLINFFEKRCCNRAQWEIKEVADQMLDLVLEVAPHLFAKAGAKCVFGACPEGNKSCGKKQEPRQLQKVKKYER